MKLGDIGSAKESLDIRTGNGYQTVPQEKLPSDPRVPCIDNAKNRMKTTLGISTLGRSFAQAVDSAEGTEIFTVWEQNDEFENRVILKNQKDNWQQDVKYINAPLGRGFVVGNTVTWKRLNMRWLITWQDYNLDEFFRGEMRRANYQIYWRDKNGILKHQWVAVQGPVETRAKYEQTTSNVIIGRQNDSLEMWMGSNGDKDIEDLTRYDKINIKGRCWRLQVMDNVSNPEVLRFTCVEDFNNSVTDDMVYMIPNGLRDYPEQPEENSIKIVAPGEMREKLVSKVYAVDGKTGETVTGGTWSIEGEATFEPKDDTILVKPKTYGKEITIIYITETGEVYKAITHSVSMFL